MRRRTGEIHESLETLCHLEQRYGRKPQELRLKALRLLAQHPEWTLRQVADLLGRSERTLQRWWKTCQQEGLEGLLKFSKGGGKRPLRLGEEGLRELEQRLQQNGFADLKEVQRFLQERFGVSYSYSGVWYLVRLKLKAKLKTGRPRELSKMLQPCRLFKKGFRKWRIGRSLGMRRGSA